MPPTTLDVRVASGRFACDLYLPDGPAAAPLVIVAHGFSRSRTHMAGWGRRLSEEGFVVAVPTLPAWADPVRNGRAIRELVDWLADRPETAGRIAPGQMGLLGFSAGGLATLLAAAEDDRAGVWVGLDPVDAGERGAAAASRLRCSAILLRAEPHPCNARGNAAHIQHALAAATLCLLVPEATHADAEWPTDALAERICGPSADHRREVFIRYSVAALRTHLLDDACARQVLIDAERDPAVRVLTTREVQAD